ncbi:MAG: alpha/beta hydrolase domain-containing protein [Acidimicrobiia bacterium]|nr:alpha/beta hydrolase domain-containing protein [Acidimicrobiia bacterium]
MAQLIGIRSRLGIVGAVLGVLVSTFAFSSASADAVEPGSSGEIEVTASAIEGTVRRVEFTRYDCQFAGLADEILYTLADGGVGAAEFDVSCFIVLPTDSRRWDGRLVVEPLDLFTVFPPDAEAVRNLYLTDEVVLARGYKRSGYASISYAGAIPSDFIDQRFDIDSNGDGFPDLPAAAVEILADFAGALRTGGNSGLIGAGTDYGTVKSVTGVGYSNSGSALRGVMAFAARHGVTAFDATMPMAAPSTLLPDADGVTAPAVTGPQDFGTERALFVNSESDVLPNGSFDVFGVVPALSTLSLRVEADDVRRFVYEVAGAAHIDPINQADLVAIGSFPPGTFANSNTLEWSSVIRAVYIQMTQWVAFGRHPKASVLYDSAPDPTAADPAYPGHPSVVSATVDRDSNLNTLGGIRLPDVELGVGTFRGVGPPITFAGDPLAEVFLWLAGSTEDLSCVPLADGSPRFKNNRDYVRKVAGVAGRLVADRFLLLSDAAELVREARDSGIGNCN